MSSPLMPLLAISATTTVLAIAFAAVCLFLMLVVLAQKPKGGGLAGAFGGSGGSEGALLGAKVGDFLTYTTVGFFILFILLAMGLTWAINPDPAPVDDADLLDPAALVTETTDAGDAGATAPDGETLGTDEAATDEAETAPEAESAAAEGSADAQMPDGDTEQP